MTLEDRIRKAIKSGGLLSLSLYPSALHPGMWICTYLNDGGKKRESVMDADPIKALEIGISPLKQPGEVVKPGETLDASSKHVRRRRDLEDIL